MSQGIILVQLLQQVFQTGDVLFLLADVLCQLLPVIRLVSRCFLRKSATETVLVCNGIAVDRTKRVSHNFPNHCYAYRIVCAEPFFISGGLFVCPTDKVSAIFVVFHAVQQHWHTALTANH